MLGKILAWFASAAALALLSPDPAKERFYSRRQSAEIPGYICDVNHHGGWIDVDARAKDTGKPYQVLARYNPESGLWERMLISNGSSEYGIAARDAGIMQQTAMDELSEASRIGHDCIKAVEYKTGLR